MFTPASIISDSISAKYERTPVDNAQIDKVKKKDEFLMIMLANSIFILDLMLISPTTPAKSGILVFKETIKMKKTLK
jgi:hypothetical protein